MTTPTDPALRQEAREIEVTQADRDAAAEYNRLFPDLWLTEAFARHRLAAMEEALEEAAKVAEALSWGQLDMPDDFREAKQRIATAIRALKSRPLHGQADGEAT